MSGQVRAEARGTSLVNEQARAGFVDQDSGGRVAVHVHALVTKLGSLDGADGYLFEVPRS